MGNPENSPTHTSEGPVDRNRSWIRIVIAASAILAFAAALPAVWQRWTGAIRLAEEPFGNPIAADFELETCTIDRDEVMTAGAGRDDIPALSNPRFTTADRSVRLHGSDRVAGVVIDGQPRAYPLRILERHEVVNDSAGTVPFAVTYCPLCDSVAVFDRRMDDGTSLEFGVSGLLYKSNALFYDRGTSSLWSQIGAAGVSGDYADSRLRSLPVELTSWADWSERYPQSQVLSFETGHDYSYQFSPYQRYFADGELMFDVQPASTRLPEMARVLGVWSGDAARAYPIAEFELGGRDLTLTDQFDGVPVTIHYAAAANALRLEASPSLPRMYAFWFAWYAFRPHTDVFEIPLSD